jgi:tetratricopeptide (TPR) repeat protein
VSLVRLVRFIDAPSTWHPFGTTVDGMSGAASESGGRLRALLQRTQLTPEQFAHRINLAAAELGLTARIDKKTPYKWLRGGAPRQPWPALAASVLGRELRTEIGPEDLGWCSAKVGLTYVPANDGLDVPWNGAGSISAAGEVTETSTMDRRIFLQVSGTALTQPAFEWLIAKPADDTSHAAGRRVTDAQVDSIEDITGQLRRMDDQFGGGMVLDPVKSQVRFVLDLLQGRQYTTSVGRRLHGAAAELLRLAGWASYDSGQHAAAQRFWTAALHGAQSAGDRALGANILGFMADQATDLGLPTEAVHLAEAARRGYPGASTRVSAILHLRVAGACAHSGDSTDVRNALDSATEMLRRTNHESSHPAWSYWLNEAVLNEQAGRCYLRLNEWSQAQNHLASAIRLRPEAYRRQSAFNFALLATAFARQGEAEQACVVANKAVDALEDDVDSTRCIDHVRLVRDALVPYRRLPAVRAFEERVTQLSPAAN